MVGKSVLKLSNINIESNTNSSISDSGGLAALEKSTEYSPLQIATALCFVVGMWQLFMYLLHLGVASSLLSETLVSGFTTGAAIHVLTSQIKDLLGIKLIPVTGYFEIIFTYKQIFENLHNFNRVAVIMSCIAIIVLVLNNELIKPRLAKKTSMPLPIELIIVILGTVSSSYLFLEENHSISTIGHIPTGFPEPSLPSMKLAKELLIDGFVIAIVSYSTSVSMGLILAQKFNYEIGFNQELLAMGAGNIFGSFFGCMPFAASLSRSYIQQSAGGRTQVASIVSCVILAIVLLWVGPVFEPLPRCCIASIVVVALKGLLMQVTQLYDFWKLSKMDALLWIGTFLSVVLISIDIGLLVGVILSLACIFFKGVYPYSCLLGRIPDTELYLDITRYKAAVEIDGIKIFHFCGCLNFCTKTIFKSDLYSLVPLDAERNIERCKNHDIEKLPASKIQYLVLDFSSLSYIDSSGVGYLKSLIKELDKKSITVYIAGASISPPVFEMMRKCGISNLQSDVCKLFPTVQDAVSFALEKMLPTVKSDVMSCYM